MKIIYGLSFFIQAYFHPRMLWFAEELRVADGGFVHKILPLIKQKTIKHQLHQQESYMKHE